MVSMQQVISAARTHNGMFTPGMIKHGRASRMTLKRLVDTGRLVRQSRGFYTLPDAWGDDFVRLQARFKQGVYCLGTALFLWDLTDRTPEKYQMMFPLSSNVTGAGHAGVACTRVKDDFYRLGVVEVATPGGGVVQAYCAEKTLCDVLRPVYRVDRGMVAEALKRYVASDTCDVGLLSQYARTMRVEGFLRPYLEVLL